MDYKTRSSRAIPAHYGMRDYHTFFCEEYPELNIDKQTYNKVISEYNKYVASILIEALEIKLPFKLGKIEILKELRKLYLNDEGKVINTNPVNWKSTLDLWSKNQEAKDKKILIRFNNKHTGGYVFRIYYNKKTAVFKNKKVYFFQPVRILKRSIATRINDYSKNKYDTYIKE